MVVSAYQKKLRLQKYPNHSRTLRLHAFTPTTVATMPKSAQKKGNSSRSTPYSPAAAKAKSANNIFKFNTGQLLYALLPS
jgi:hypothetical protein